MVNMNRPRTKPGKLKLLIILSLTLLITTPLLITAQPTAAQNTDYIEKTFSWDYEGKHWNWNLSIPTTLYEAYKEVPVSTRTRSGPGGYGYLTTTEDSYIRMLADKLNQTTTSMGYDSYDQVSFILAFVQSLPYTSDNVTQGYNEYPRFPIETLVEDGGDCEDTSILFASITLLMGYGTVYINPPNHYAVGILGNNIHGTYWTYPKDSNKTYYYCETTGDNFKIGQLPEEFYGQSASIYEIDERDQFVPDVVVYATTEATPTKAPVISSAKPTPDVTNPTAQTPHPLSFNLITDNPLISIVMIFAIVLSVILAIWSVRRPRHSHKTETADDAQLPSQPNSQETAEDGKYCIHCGVPNKGYAAYCEKCGKQIG